MSRLAALLLLPLLLVACTPAAVRPDVPPTHRAAELDPIAHWVGGRWVGTFEAGGRKFTLIRTYEWAFDGRVILGKSFAERDGTLVQQRETPFYWNPETRRIEFVDVLDNGGFGAGWLDRRDGQLYMDVRIVGNPKHPSWRGWVRESPDAQVIRIEAQQGGTWVDFGTYAYRRER